MFRCRKCGEEFYYSDEVIGFNINDEEVSLEEYVLELNTQNPDYLKYVICIDCYSDLDS